MSRGLSVDAWFDFICPWCLIGKRNLASALELLRAAEPDVDVRVRWHGTQLLPQLPPRGRPFMEFYIDRLGSEHAVRSRQAMVLEAARAAGAVVDFSRIGVMPNTADAHRVFEAACALGTTAQAEALLERLFAAHFSGGADLSDTAVLMLEAAECGLDPQALAHLLQGGQHPFAPAIAASVEPSGGVPFYVLNNWLSVSGAQPPAVLLQAMQRALERTPA
jgi:predicted DsbA family dithiol-disulfide isomerase